MTLAIVSERTEQEIQDYRVIQQIIKDPTMYDFFCNTCRRKYVLTNKDILDDPDCACIKCGTPQNT